MKRKMMRKTICLLSWMLVILAVGFLHVDRLQGEAAKRMTIERLYSLPRVIGTAPRGFAWSPDSKHLAFLWNDEGTNFYDVWMIEADAPEPVRITRMPRPEVEPVTGDPVATLEREARAQQDPGVRYVIWHPDNRHLLFTFKGDHYWVEPGEEPERLTSTRGGEARAAYSPDGRLLAYLLEGDIWVESAAPEGERQPKNLTQLAGNDVRVESFEWAPNGEAVAFLIVDETNVPVRKIPDYLLDETDVVSVHRPFPGEEPASLRLAVASVRGAGEIRWIALGPDPVDYIFGYRWSPDSQRLLVDTSDLCAKDRRILIADAATTTALTVYREQNPLNISAFWRSEWAPDGEGFYFLSDRDEDFHIYFLPVEGGTPLRLTQGDWAVAEFEVLLDAVVFIANKGRPEERHIFRVDPAGGEPVQISERAGTHAPTFSPDGRYAADYFSGDEMPPELLLTAVSAATGGGTREVRVTHSPLPEFSEFRWVKPEYVTFPSHVDGVTLYGRLTVPPNLDRSKKHPAILGSVYSDTVRNQWGGRTAHPTWGLDQYLVQEGYILLNVDMRGSWGHGKAYRQGLRLDYGGVDIDDLHSGVKYLETLGFVDMSRIGIWGSSYGGLMTTMSLFKKPGVYKAGVAGAPATNVWHADTGRLMVMMRPQDQPEEYANASSFKHAAGLEDHLMIIHGMRDTTVLFKDSLVLVQHLIMMEKNIDLVVLPDAPHGWDTRELYQTRFAFHKLIGHFEKHLGKGPTPD